MSRLAYILSRPKLLDYDPFCYFRQSISEIILNASNTRKDRKLAKAFCKRTKKASSIDEFFHVDPPAALSALTFEDICNTDCVLQTDMVGSLRLPSFQIKPERFDVVDTEDARAIDIVFQIVDIVAKPGNYTQELSKQHLNTPIVLQVINAGKHDEHNLVRIILKLWGSYHHNIKEHHYKRPVYGIVCSFAHLQFWRFYEGKISVNEMRNEMLPNVEDSYARLIYFIIKAWLDKPDCGREELALMGEIERLNDIELKEWDFVMDRFKQCYLYGDVRFDYTETTGPLSLGYSGQFLSASSGSSRADSDPIASKGGSSGGMSLGNRGDYQATNKSRSL